MASVRIEPQLVRLADASVLVFEGGTQHGNDAHLTSGRWRGAVSVIMRGMRHRQARTATLGKAGFALGTVALAVQLALVAWLDGYSDVLHPMTLLLAAGAAAPAAMWLFCTRGERTATQLKLAEAAAVMTTATAYSVCLLYFDVQHHFERLVLLALTLVAVLRTSIVPSSVTWTAGLTLAMGAPMLIFTGLSYQHYVPIAGDVLGAAHRPSVMVVWSLVWWIASFMVCVTIARTIHGLRRQVSAIRQLGQYTLGRKLGEGGMGSVFAAEHAMLRRPTAIKLLPPTRTGERDLARFEREVQLTSALTHPNTITIFDYGRTPDGVFYYAMELLDGATLDDIVEVTGAQPAPRALAVMKMVASALVEAHDVGLVHRDIKPGNIILCKQGGLLDVAKVVDFGLVKDLDTDDARISRPEEIEGTPLYLSPEAISSPKNVDPRSDLYALGAVGFFLLTGEHVFASGSLVEICHNHLHSQPRRPSELVDNVPRDLENVILECLRKDPAGRPQTAADLVERLEACDYVSEWTQSDAQGWWRDNEHSVHAQRESSYGSHQGDTVAIDLRGRN